MGDGTTAGVVAMLPQQPTDSQTCSGNRSPPAVGVCYSVTYTPLATGVGWAGVYWQHPLNNWGADPGYAIPAGATKVTLWAKGAAGGESVKFVAGGIAGGVYQDALPSTSTTAVLTTTWTQYTITLPATPPYGMVLGGFAWSAGAQAGPPAPVTFSIDSIEWH
jgi:hypothetical protein